jgi:hypothetical protein
VRIFVINFRVKAIFHCSRFARAGGATNFNDVKKQSRGHAKKVECSSTFMACPPARAKRLQWKIALNVNHIISFLGTVMKTLGSDRIRKSPKLPSSPEVKFPSKELTTISHSSETKWQNNGGKTMSLLENQIFHPNDLRGTAKREKFASLTTQNLRNRREIDVILESPTECANFTSTIKYEDEYRVWNNFSMMYESRMYH